MTRAIALAVCMLLAGACTMVKINPDNTTTIEHEPGAEKDLANRACRKGGEQTAVIISTTNKDPALPAGTGKQVTTFRCTSEQQRP